MNDRADPSAGQCFDEVDGRIHVKLRKIVRCESRFNPRADSGEYKGLFQQVAKYGRKRVADFNRHHNPDVGDNIYSPFDNARVSARMFAAGMQEHWLNCA